MPLLHRCSVCGSWFEKGATEPDADGEPRRAWGYEVTAQMAVAMADALESGGPAGSLHGAVPKVLRAHRERCGAGAHPRLTAPGYEKLIACRLCFELYNAQRRMYRGARALLVNCGVERARAPDHDDESRAGPDVDEGGALALRAPLTLVDGSVTSTVPDAPDRVVRAVGAARGAFRVGDPVWRRGHLPRGAGITAWRILVLCHRLDKVSLSSSAAAAMRVATPPGASGLGGQELTKGFVRYELGQRECHAPFSFAVVDDGLNAHHPIRCAHVHFAFASAAGVREVFELKQVPIELYSGAVGDPAAQLEGEGKLDLAPLLELVDGDNGFGLGKFDRALPVRTRTLGLVLLRVSVALVRDDATTLPCSRRARAVPDLPVSLRKLCLMREVSPRHTESELSLYWPPSDYHDARPLPAPWIDMMSTQPAEEDILIGDDDEFVDSAFKSAWQQRRERNTIAADEFIEKFKQHLHQRGLGTDGDRRVSVSNGHQNDADDESAQAGVARRAMAALAADERFVVARSHSRWRRRRRLEILGVLWDTAIRSASLASPSKPA